MIDLDGIFDGFNAFVFTWVATVTDKAPVFF